MSATAAIYIPVRYERVIIRSADGSTREAVVTAFNYCFERLDGVYVDYPGGAVNCLAWLHQVEPFSAAPIRARSLVFGPRRPNGEFGTFAYSVAQVAPRDVRLLIEMYGSGHAVSKSCQLRAKNLCRAAYWRAVADAQARGN